MAYKLKVMKLNKKLILSLVSVIILAVTFILTSIDTVFEKKFEEYIIKNNESNYLNLISSIQSQYYNGNWNVDNIEEIGKNAIDNGLFIDVYNEENNLIWSAIEYNEDKCHSVRGSIENNMNNMISDWKGKYIEQNFSLNSTNNQSIGNIKIGSYGYLYYMENEVSFIEDIKKVILVIGILMSIVMIIIAILIAKKISKPIEVVSNMANSMGSGGYKNKINYQSDILEIDTLIKSINDLSYKLEEQENLRKRLTTDISHELRTPLTSIQTHLEAMIDGIWKADTERLNSVNEEVIRLTSLVNQLKNLAKFDSEKSNLNLTQVNLEYLIKNIVYNNQVSALEKDIDINFNLESIGCYLDKEKISQVIVNLLSNAIRYTENGGKIDISLYKENNNNIKIHIKDSGIGIPKESVAYIFERFYRVDKSRSKETGGIGVGLTIVKSIVELHNGIIEVKSKVDKGSEFIITLPIIYKDKL